MNKEEISLKFFYDGNMKEKDVVSIIMSGLRTADPDCFIVMAPLNQQQPHTPQSVEQDELWNEAGGIIIGYLKQKAQLIHLTNKLSKQYLLTKIKL